MSDGTFKDEISRRDAMKVALKAGAYSAPVIIASTIPKGVAAISPSIADLVVTLTANPANPGIGGTSILTITVTNNGPSPATGVVITDKLPAGLTYVSSVPSQGTYDPVTGLWNVGALAVSSITPNLTGANRLTPLAVSSATLQIMTTVNGSTINTAMVTSSDQTDPVPGNNSANQTFAPTTTSTTTGPTTSTTAAPPTTTTLLPTTTTVVPPTTTVLPTTTIAPVTTTTIAPVTTTTIAPVTTTVAPATTTPFPTTSTTPPLTTSTTPLPTTPLFTTTTTPIPL